MQTGPESGSDEEAADYRQRRGKLRREAEFQRVRAIGRSWSSPVAVVRAAPNPGGPTRFGIVATKRLGNAVTRNRARRRVRDVLRRLGAGLRAGWDVVIVVRAPLLEGPYARLESDLADLLRRAGVYTGKES